MKSAIIMAAGKGTRMNSVLPKVLHEICHKPMIELILDKMDEIQVDKVVTVVGYGHEKIEEAMAGRCMFALQMPQMGTGHAVAQATQLKEETGLTLVANGDCPRIESATYQRLFEECQDASMVVLTAKLDDPKSYGRVVRNEAGFIEKIVEFKDCNEEEKKICEINTGIYCFNNQDLFNHLNELTNDNAQHEYYITDMVEVLNKKGLKVKALILDDPKEAEGVNDKLELAQANQWLKEKINREWLRQGVTMPDYQSVTISPDVKIGKEVTIYPNCTLIKNTEISDGCTIYPGTWIENSKIGENCIIETSNIVDSIIEKETTVKAFSVLCNKKSN